MPASPTPGISTQDIMRKLCVSRTYVTNNITHTVKHLDNPRSSLVIFDETELRKWLMQHATFTRQTQYIDLDAYAKKHILHHTRYSAEDIIGQVPRIYDHKQRGLYPYTKVKPFDFWDKPLIFPKNYTDVNGNKKSAEMCYRAMFDEGAIKIQLGLQKTMFYIPAHKESDFFVSADWIPLVGCKFLFEETPPCNDQDPDDREFQLTFASSPLMQKEIISALRKVFNIKRIIPGELSSTSYSQDYFICTMKRNY